MDGNGSLWMQRGFKIGMRMANMKRDANCYLISTLRRKLASDYDYFRPKASEEDTPSSWAQKEVFSAISEGLVPACCRAIVKITREEFALSS